MLNDYIIVDDILKDPFELISLSQNIKYFTMEESILSGVKIATPDEQTPKSYWRGYRSEHLNKLNRDLFLKVNSNILEKTFKHNKFNFYIDSFLNITDQSIPYYDGWWHTDSGFIAGVIYLNHNAPKDTGTLLRYNNNILNVDNKFNRLIMYRSNILHRPAGFFGNSFDTARLTLTFFIKEITFSS